MLNTSLMAFVWVGLAQAMPSRPALGAHEVVEGLPGQQQDRVVVKLVDGAKAAPILEGVQFAPLFSRDPKALREAALAYDPAGLLPDLGSYYIVRTPDGQAAGLARTLNTLPWVERAYLPLAPVYPPTDLPPTTPNFVPEQTYLGPAPDGFGFSEAQRWPGADGRHVAVADLEYGWERGHEDLEAVDQARTWGVIDEQYAFRFHGNGVLGVLFADDNDYGVVGLVPRAEPVVVHPFTEAGEYNIAAAIEGAVSMLQEGDVLLIEQQAFLNGDYAPVEVDPAVFDAIAHAVAQGVTVVEPAGNGGQDLDAAVWEGWFDREFQDSGAILVGGGASPHSGLTPRSWLPNGSCYGSRVDVQGWYENIVSTINGDSGGRYADLYFPDGDGRQAYTRSFGGTSGASPQVAAVAAAVNSASIELTGAPLSPLEVRALLVSTGTPQAAGDGEHIGPQPDLARALRYGVLP